MRFARIESIFRRKSGNNGRSLPICSFSSNKYCVKGSANGDLSVLSKLTDFNNQTSLRQSHKGSRNVLSSFWEFKNEDENVLINYKQEVVVFFGEET